MLTPIGVDYREVESTSALLAKHLPPNSVETGHHLQYGDVWWATEQDTFGGEMKSVSDLLHSLWSKERGERLEKQLIGLRETYGQPFLAIHGILLPTHDGMQIMKEGKYTSTTQTFTAKQAAHTKVKQAQLDGFLWAIAHPVDGRPVTTIWRPTKDSLMGAIAEIYRWSQKNTHATFQHLIAKPKTRNPAVDMLIGAGLGEVRARALIERFKSLIAVLLAPEEELLSVKGIGKTTVNMLQQAAGLSELRNGI